MNGRRVVLIAVGIVAICAALLALQYFVEFETGRLRAERYAVDVGHVPQETGIFAALSSLPSRIEASRLASSGCFKGQVVAATHSTDFDTEEGPTLVAEYGIQMTVDPERSAGFTRCYVSSIDGRPVQGSVPLHNIVPWDKMVAMLKARGINQRVTVTMAEFPARLRADLPMRAQDWGVDLATFEPTVRAAVAFIKLCSGITRERLDAARERWVDRVAHNPEWDTYRSCVPEVLGTAIPGKPRGLIVDLQLRSDKTKNPYNVVVEYEPVKAIDGDRMVHAKTINEGYYALYEAYGVGTYTVTP